MKKLLKLVYKEVYYKDKKCWIKVKIIQKKKKIFNNLLNILKELYNYLKLKNLKYFYIIYLNIHLLKIKEENLFFQYVIWIDIYI